MFTFKIAIESLKNIIIEPNLTGFINQKKEKIYILRNQNENQVILCLKINSFKIEAIISYNQ